MIKDHLLIDHKRLLETIDAILKQYVQLPDLKEFLQSFIDSKSSFPFAELCYFHHQIFNGVDEEECYRLASAIELWILSLDMFDDFEDVDNFEEPWMKLDQGIGLNCATFLFSLSQLVVSSLKSPNKLQILTSFQKFSMQAMRGQHLELSKQIETEDQCLEMIKWKSGSLTAFAAVAGMLLATGDYIEEVCEYSYQIGIAAQIQNDYQGLFSKYKDDGKCDKPSLTLLYIMNHFNDECVQLQQYIQSGKTFEEFFGSEKAFKQKLFDSGVTSYLNVMKHIALQKAITKIRMLPLSDLEKDRIVSFLITGTFIQ